MGLATLAQNVLKNNSSSLTAFQQSLVQVVLIAAPYSSVITASLSGIPLNNSQNTALNQLGAALHANAAVQTLLSFSARLKSNNNTNVLQLYVNDAIAADLVPLHAPTTLGDPTLDAVVADIYALQSSSAFQAFLSALLPLLQNPGFVPFLQTQQPIFIANFVPPDVKLALLLPGDKDPFTSATLEAILEVIAAVAGTIVGIATLPADLAIGLAILAGIGFGAALSLAFIHLFKAIDCDFDGDPSDPNDVPGNECPS